MKLSPRLPFLVLMAGLAGGVVMAGVGHPGRPTGGPAGQEVRSGHPQGRPDQAPTRSAPVGSMEPATTWYCAAGTAGGVADHTVILRNLTGETVDVDLTAYVAGEEDGTPAPVAVAVPAHQRERVDLRDLVGDRRDGRSTGGDRFVAALVEAGRGQIVAEHEVAGPHGVSTGPCATQGASEWHFPWGATTRDARNVLALFNPFPSDVVVDAVFSTPGGTREPLRWQGMIVPAGQLVVVDVGEDVTRRPLVAASVRARMGSLVVEQVQVLDGSLDVEGTWLALGQQEPRGTTTFPGGAGERELVTVYNPGTSPAEVDVLVEPAGSAEPPLPFRLVVRPGEVEALDYGDESRIDLDRRRTTTVTATNGVPVVAQRVVLPAAADDPPGRDAADEAAAGAG